VFALYLKRSFRSMKSFCSFQEVYGERLVFSSKVFMCLLCGPFSPLMGRFFNHSFSSMFTFKGNLWDSYIAKTLKTFDSNYCFKRHHCCHVLITPPLLDLVPQPIFYYQPKHTFVLNRFLFAKAFTTTPHLSLGGFF
jgi:hypothetical protein